MLNGSLLGPMVSFAVPLIASGVLQQSFNSVDVAIAGRFAGSNALAAVGSNGPIIGLFINLFLGLSIGANVVIANYVGRRNSRGIVAATGSTIFLAIACGLLMMTLTLGLAEPLLRALDTPIEVLPLAVEYLRIFAIGMPFMLLYNFGSAILRAVGDTRRPFYILVVAGCINVLLNCIFVIGMDMGVAGVAWGTVISNIVNAGATVWLMMHERSEVRLIWREVKPRRTETLKIAGIGLPAGLQSTVFSMSNVFILGAINTFGAKASAGSAAALIYETYCYFVIVAFAQTATAFVSQNFGAGQYDRCRKVLKLSIIMSASVSVILDLGLYFTRYTVLLPFTDDGDVMFFAGQRMMAVLAFQFIACYYEMAGATMRGLNHSMTPALITIFGTCVLRLLWIAFLPSQATFAQLLTVYPVSWILTNTMMFLAMKRVLKQELK